MHKRELYIKIWQELSSSKNMIFIAGPRQTGKTTLTQIISKSFTNKLYFNWDIPDNRTNFIENRCFFEDINLKDSSLPLITLDEIHKYKDWKNYLKGIYDQFHLKYKFIVSGSGRLDIYQKGGDSLAGRYLIFHLFPFTVSELGKHNTTIKKFLKNPIAINMDKNKTLKKIWERLSDLSGFPEPYLSNKITTYRRWSNIYSNQLIREDVRELTGIKSAIDMETLYLLLPSKVGSPVSITSIAGDLKVSYNSVSSWLSILERFFLTFKITTWTAKISRAIHKDHKVYLFDIPRIKDPAAKFENMIALELFRAITNWNNLGYGLFSLHFVRNKEKQEVDFLIVNEQKPILLVEAKLSNPNLSPSLKKFQNALNIPAVQLVNKGDSFRILHNGQQSILVAPAYQWLAMLP